MRRPMIAVAGILVFLTLPAFAEDAEMGGGRYQITPSEEGFTRLDTETGSLSHCGKRDGVWYCEPLAGPDSALERRLDGLAGEVARLAANLDALAARVDALAGHVDGLAAGLPGAGAGPAGGEEARRADEALNFAEKVMRRFFDLVREMKRAELDRI